MWRLLYLISIHFLLVTSLFSQGGVIKGKVFNKLNNEAIPFANVVIDGTTKGTTTDLEGNYSIDGLEPGTYNINVSYLGFKPFNEYEIMVTNFKASFLDIALEESAQDIKEVVVKASPFNKTMESPLSMRSINATEIYRNPGGNRDISKVIQSLPGVGTTISFRNDIIIRGGAPNENRFYLDGIEVPNINHFATQGSSGGPVGMINVNFIKEVDFYAGAFPANRGNTLSSIMEFKQIEGNPDKLNGNFMVGSSDIGLTLNGPLGEKSNMIFSVRRSYLQFLFMALGLPFLPTYNDFQLKYTYKPNTKNKISFIGLGAIDDFMLYEQVNDGVTDSVLIDRNDYILGNLPVNTQWNYTIGAKWQHYFDESYTTMVVSRSALKNKAFKFRDNIETDANRLLDYNSLEAENKFRFEYTTRKNGWKWNSGFGYELSRYTTSTFQKIAIGATLLDVDYDSELFMNKGALFTQLSKGFIDNRMIFSFGLRTDFNDYSKEMSNPLKQLSPRLSMSYALNEKWSYNFNVGRYYQLPAYTVLGYRDFSNNQINKENGVTFIQADHLVSGIEFNPNKFSKITVEGFYKWYNNYPFLLRDSISLANLGGDFGVIGNEPVKSTSSGRSYGVEFLAQQKLSESIYGIVAYTLVRSEFEDKSGKLRPSAWDNVHIINITAGKKFARNWEIGLKFRFSGGSPFTPYDMNTSALKSVWDVRQQGLFDWNRLNENRYPIVHAIDMRIDKKWFFKKWGLNLYFDMQNIYNYAAEVQPYLNVKKDASGQAQTDPNNPLAYDLYLIPNTSGNILPSLGIMIDF